MKENWLIDGPADASLTIVLAHGAGASMDTPFMDFFAAALAANGHQVVRFEFPYMAKRRTTGRKGGPDRMPVLLSCWREVLAALDSGRSRIVVGGKSMGGRVASMIASEVSVAGVLCLGYPFHPSGKPDRLRTDHLFGLRAPCLFVQGTRDTLGNRDEVSAYDLPGNIQMHWLEDGDHSFKPRKLSGRTERDNLQEGAAAAVAFAGELT